MDASERRGCFTSARASGGRAWWAARHARRIARDARLVGLGEVDPGLALRLLAELAAPSRDGGDLKVRLVAQPDRDGAPCLRGGAISLAPDPAAWRAITAPAPHPGPSPTSAAKTTDRAYYDAALAAGRGADEALCLDACGRLVEGCRTNLVVVLADGALATPPLARGAQAGIAREILLERCAELRERDVDRASLTAAREVVAVNAVRGARAVVAIDGSPVGDGRPGPWSARLGDALRRC